MIVSSLFHEPTLTNTNILNFSFDPGVIAEKSIVLSIASRQK